MKPRILPLLLSFLLLGCKKNARACYQCFYGFQSVLSCSPSYESINQKKMQMDFDPEAPEGDYHVEYSWIRGPQELQSWEETTRVSLSSSDRRILELDEGEAELVVFAQIPKGYKAYRRNPVQEETEDGETLVTNGFYFYRNRTYLSYLYIDVLEDSEATLPSVFSFNIRVFSDAIDVLSGTEIRTILTNHRATEDDIPQEMKS